MSFVASRTTAINSDGFYGEPEQDANSALTELDKGLRSLKVGEQCEAIVRFPKLFEKYPFPILINSACLKLADVFRVGNNFLRLWVFKVTQQSEKHLDKILNVDEYVKRLYTVIYSNDPLARALTLRTLGSIASIIPERKNVHHSIRDSFDSHDAVELEAAVYAANKFSKYSKDFAGSICNKIEQMIQKLSTPVEMKLKLIPILQNMHHDAQTSAVVRKLCTYLLNNYPAEEFVIVTLRTLTNLSASTLFDIPEQVKLLVKYLEQDARVSVKNFILRELKSLAVKGGHLWNTEHIMAVVKFVRDAINQDLQCNSLEVLASLAESPEAAFKLLNLSKHDDYSISELCQQCSYNENVYLASRSIQLSTSLALHNYQATGDDTVFYDTATSIECLLIVVSSLDNANAQQILAMKTSLKCAVKLCNANIELCYRFIDAIGDLSISATGSTRCVLLEALCAIGNIKAGVLSSVQPELIIQLKEILSEQKDANSLVVAKLCTLIFQAMKDQIWLSEDERLIVDVAKCSKLWDTYRIGRQAARYGHHKVAMEIFSSLTTKVSLESHHFWMVSLVELCKAETFLCEPTNSSSFMDKINFAIMHYMKGISALKATTTPAHQMDMQCEYMKLRSEMLKAFVFLMQACNTLRSCPPPAIAASMAMTSRDDLQRSGRVIMQLRKTANDFHKVANKYREFSQVLFNADPVTLKILQILQFNCLLTAHAISCVVLRETNFPFSDPSSINVELRSPNLEVESMSRASSSATDIVNNYLSSAADSENVTYKQMDVLANIMYELLKVPVSFPRYFFQSLQTTSVKLAISPQQRGVDPIHIQNGSHLAVKVEGVIQHNSKPGIFREVSKIQLSVSSVLQQRASANIDVKVVSDATNNMKQVVTPHNEYFSAQFLIAFPVAGTHTVTITTSLIDQNSKLWNTGPQSTLSIKSFEDPSVANKANQSASTHRQNFPHRF